jgi:hypothetical protein
MKKILLFLFCMATAFSVFATETNKICVKISHLGAVHGVKTNYCLESELSSDGTCDKYKHSKESKKDYSISLGYKADGITPATKIYITTMACTNAGGKVYTKNAIKDITVDLSIYNDNTFKWNNSDHSAECANTTHSHVEDDSCK